MKKLFSNSAEVFFCNELENQNSKAIINLNDGSEEHWKSKHKLD
jgi:hypothetical protein